MTPPPDNNPWVRRTRTAVLAGTAVVILYDLAAYLAAGGQATVSTLVGGWLRKSAWVVLLAGLLVGHLLASGPTPAPWPTWLLFAVAVGVGFACTVGLK